MIDAFRGGAADVLLKPFRSHELVARVRAIARRYRGLAQDRLELGRMSVVLGDRTATIDGSPVRLTRREYAVLETLLTLHHPATVSRDALLDQIYGDRDEPDPHVLNVVIHRLRRKIGVSWILTMRGSGSRLEIRVRQDMRSTLETAPV